MKSLASVVLFVYNRPIHTKNTINSLINCNLSEKTNLYVISDGYKSNTDKELVKKVRQYLKNVKHFNQIKLIERNTNFGLANNIIKGVTEILDIENRIIVLEDDLILSNNFLIFMNAALNYYQDNKKVGSISGYSFPVKVPRDYSYEIYFNTRPSSWGWAIWKDRWDKIEWDINRLNLQNIGSNEINIFNKSGNDLFRTLEKQKKGKINSWAIRLAYHQYKNNLFTVYPLITKVENHGVGYDATHTKFWNIPKNRLDNLNFKKFIFSNQIELAKNFDKSFKNNFSYTQKVIRIIKYLLNK